MKCNTIPDLEKFLAIQEQALGMTTPEVATTLTQLAELYFANGDIDKAESLYQRSYEIREGLHGFHRQGLEHVEQRLNEIKAMKTGQSGGPHESTVPGAEPPNVAPEAQQDTGGHAPITMQHDVTASVVNTVSGISSVNSINSAIQEAEVELELLKQMVGPDHFSVADQLNKLADLYCRLRMYNKMEPLLVDALRIREAVCGPEHHSVATDLKNLGALYCAQERYALAEPLLKRAIILRERTYGRMHPRVADVEAQYAQLLRKTNRIAQAEALERHINEIRNDSTLFSCDSSFFGAAIPKPRR